MTHDERPLRATTYTAGRFFVTGGTLKPGAASYVERSADGELWQRLASGDYCYVLTARQMGKSSLMARTASRLRAAGDHAAVVDLTQIGSGRAEAAAEQWYFGALHAIHRGLRLTTPLKTWWTEQDRLSPVQRFVNYFRDVALVETTVTTIDETVGRIVIFVGEIDATIGLPFGSEFFAAIRACFNARAEEEAFARLSFVLLGVATPDQLIDDPARTPFNIGQRIELTDFSRDEARRLTRGFGNEEARHDPILDRILHWTGGQPYLTQVLCHRVSERTLENTVGTNEAVDQLVDETFLNERALRHETHFRNIRSRLCGNDEAARRRLTHYRRIWRGKRVQDAALSPDLATLKLSGVVRGRDDDTLTIRNRLYERVFTDRWANDEMPIDRARRVGYSSVAAMLVMLLCWYALLQPRPYIAQLALAVDDHGVATAAHRALRRNPFARWRADELMAQFWDRRFRRAALEENRDHALLHGLQALTWREQHERWQRVAAIADTDLRHLERTFQHTEVVHNGGFSRDGASLFTYSSDNTLRLWRVADSSPITPPLVHESRTITAHFSADNALFFTWTADRAGRVWSASTGEPTGQFWETGTFIPGGASLSPERPIVLTRDADDTAQLWDLSTAEPIGQPLPGGLVFTDPFSPDGTAVVTSSWDGLVRVWDPTTGEPLGQPFQHEGMVDEAMVYQVAFGADGQIMLTRTRDGLVKLWDRPSGQSIGQAMRHDGVTRVAFGNRDEWVLTGSRDGTTRVWSSTTGAPLSQPIVHDGRVIGLRTDDDFLDVTTSDYTVHRWRLPSATTLVHAFRHDSEASSAIGDRDGKSVLTGGMDGTIQFHDATTGRRSRRLVAHDGPIESTTFDSDGKAVLTTGHDRTVRLWAVPAIDSMQLSHETIEPVALMCLSPDGAMVATLNAHQDTTAQLTPTRDGGATNTPILHHDGAINDIAFSPDGVIVLTGSTDNTARLWDTATSQPMGQPMQHRGPVRRVAFSPDRATVATASYDKTARLWDAATGEPIGVPMTHDRRVTGVWFSPNGKTILTASQANTAFLWRTDTNESVGEPLVHGAAITSAFFSPDGATVVIATADNTTRLWNTANGAPVGAPIQHEKPVLAVAVAPDGETAWVRTARWLHVHAITTSGLEHRDSRFLDTRSDEALIVPGRRLVGTPCDATRRALLQQTANASLDSSLDPSYDRFKGDPDALIEEWQRRLALVFDENMRIAPRWPMDADPLPHPSTVGLDPSTDPP